MDIRIAAYRPVTLTTTQAKGQAAVSTLQDASSSLPVTAAAPIRPARGNPADGSSQPTARAQLMAQPGFAATDQRGTLVNILA